MQRHRDGEGVRQRGSRGQDRRVTGKGMRLKANQKDK